MTGTLVNRVGFAHADRRSLSPSWYAASLQLVAGVALVVSTAVAATVVSIGIARADEAVAAASTGRSFAVAVLIGLTLAGWRGLTALTTRPVASRLIPQQHLMRSRARRSSIHAP